MPFRTTRLVEFHDTDMAGIMHFAAFYLYMASTEHEFFRSLDISPMFADAVVGWPAAKSEALLKRLREFATQDRFVYWHDWKQGDLVIWNNYRALHSAAGHKNRYKRTMNRATIQGEIEGRRG